MVSRQGGDASQIDEPQRLPQATIQHEVLAPQSGYLAGMNTSVLGWAAVHLGAGRQEKGQVIDHAVGFVMPVKVGARIHQGDQMATIHAQSIEEAQQAEQEILSALIWSEQEVAPLPHFYGTVQGD
jgi:pyrimidine-nucleoside phosphorylase